MTTIRTVNVELTSDDVRYILHALNEFKKSCADKVAEDENGDGELTHMYANDVMYSRMLHEKLYNAAAPVFGESALEFSYELL